MGKLIFHPLYISLHFLNFILCVHFNDFEKLNLKIQQTGNKDPNEYFYVWFSIKG